MHQRPTILKLVPSLRARRLSDGRIVLTQKFIEGVSEFLKFWEGPIYVYFELSDVSFGNLDDVSLQIEDLPFQAFIMTFQEIERAIVADRKAVVLLSLDDFRQSGLGEVCSAHRIACAYISEYSLDTRKRIVEAGTKNPFKRVRRKLWETQEEHKRRRAVANATGLQCNGTPTYDSYRNLSPNALLYFDTRVSVFMLATPDEVCRRLRRTIPDDPLRLLYSGRLVSSKGADQLVEVAKELRARDVKFHLYICGEGDLKPTIREQIRRAQLNHCVTLSGVLEFKTELLPFVKSTIDLFVCCHTQGDPSCTYLETMSCGVPIAGYRNEAFEGIVRHSGCGWMVSLNNPIALAAKIAEIRRSPESLLKMSLDSLAFARKHTFDQTFSRRIHHLKALEQETAS